MCYIDYRFSEVSFDSSELCHLTVHKCHLVVQNYHLMLQKYLVFRWVFWCSDAPIFKHLPFKKIFFYLVPGMRIRIRIRSCPDLWKIFKTPLNEFSRQFVSPLYSVRRSIDALDPENKPGFGSDKIRTGSGTRALRLTENVSHQKYENEKEGLQKIRIFI